MPPRDLSQEKIDAAMSRFKTWSEDANCPGTSVAVTDQDEIIVRRGFGQRSVDTEKPATADTLYAVGSVAKPVTALATLLLDERNQLNIKDAVSEYIPYFEDAPGDPISIHQLLSHTSGMPRDDLPFIATEIDGWDAFRTFLDETMDRRRTDHHQCIYYNSGYAVLARLVEVVTGTDFPSFVECMIFDSLGMYRSTYDSSVIEKESADVMTPYLSENDEFTEASLAENPLLHGAGGLLSSATELARFLQAHMGDDPSLNSVPLERMRTPIGTLKRFVDGTERVYGYGWEIEPFNSDTLISHGGNTGVSAGFVGFLEEFKTGIAIGCNAVVDPRPIAREILAILTGRDPQAINPVKTIERAVDDLVGRYESYSSTHSAIVSRSEAQLEIAFDGEVEPFEIQAIPTSLDAGHYRFTDVNHIESTTDVEFFVTDDEVELLFEGLLLRRDENAYGGEHCG